MKAKEAVFGQDIYDFFGGEDVYLFRDEHFMRCDDKLRYLGAKSAAKTCVTLCHD